MSVSKRQPKGMYFEEFQIGQKIITSGRTITESDIVNFAGVSGDYTEIHTNAEYSSQTPIGQRIAHGLLGMSIASGLAAQTGVMDGTVLVFREIKNWKFIKPIFIGDTVHAELSVIDTKLIPRISGGSVEIEISLINQGEEIIMKGLWSVLMASRPI